MSSDDVSHYELTDRDERARQTMFQVRFWGTRGSIPTPGRSTEKFGGNTTCLEMRYGNAVLVFDAGSGIRNLGRAWVDPANEYPSEATLLFTHFHWDHIQGFPFFTPAYLPSHRFAVYSDMKLHGAAQEQLAGQMQGAYFPVPINAMRSRMEFKAVEPKFSIGPFDITTFHLPHPGGCIGYRVVAGGTTVVFATDCELESIRGGEGNPPYDSPTAGWSQDVVDFLSGADLLIIDSQYTDKAYGDCKGWGHNGASAVLSMVGVVRPAMVAMFHHDPGNSDTEISRMEELFHARAKHYGCLGFAAREGMTIEPGRARGLLKKT
jgi:phosphoribosyl 1,2-cyclic phosphodiesterase